MSYIGNPIVSTDFPVDYCSGNGSTTAFTLSIAPASVNAIDVEVSGVSQSPQTYTLSGTTLTFSAAPPSGTNNIVIKHRGIAGVPNVPSVGSVVSSSFGTLSTLPVSGGTLTLPSATGTLISTASSGQVIPSLALPAGTVLQVVNATYSATSTATGSWVDTGLTATITPKSATSKILVTAVLNGTGKSNVADCTAQFRLVRNATTIVNMDGFAGYNNAAQYNYVGTVATDYLDSPATTSATTYKTQMIRMGSGGTAYCGNAYNTGSETTCTMTLMEIAA